MPRYERPATETSVAVANTSTQILAAENSRDYVLLINNGTEDVWISLGNTAVVGQGPKLAANGGAYEIGPPFGNLTTVVINGIVDGAGPVNVAVTQME